MSFWQNLPSYMNPNLVSVGGFSIRWYSVMYIVAFLITYFFAKHRLKTEKRFKFKLDDLQDIMIWAIIGLVFGARFGYVFIYGFDYYVSHPLEIFVPFNLETNQFTGISGMSFHGGLVGSLLCSWLAMRKRKISFLEFSDFILPGIPLGFAFGRIGNFINGELYGRITQSPLGMYFEGQEVLRHPSQLYESFLEGFLLFIILWSIRKMDWTRGRILGIYIVGYALARMFVEFFRQPDVQLGFFFGYFTMGQILSSIMLLCGLVLLGRFWKSSDRKA